VFVAWPRAAQLTSLSIAYSLSAKRRDNICIKPSRSAAEKLRLSIHEATSPRSTAESQNRHQTKHVVLYQPDIISQPLIFDVLIPSGAIAATIFKLAEADGG
jgi:hypothetical protein